MSKARFRRPGLPDCPSCLPGAKWLALNTVLGSSDMNGTLWGILWGCLLRVLHGSLGPHSSGYLALPLLGHRGQ